MVFIELFWFCFCSKLGVLNMVWSLVFLVVWVVLRLIGNLLRCIFKVCILEIFFGLLLLWLVICIFKDKVLEIKVFICFRVFVFWLIFLRVIVLIFVVDLLYVWVK